MGNPHPRGWGSEIELRVERDTSIGGNVREVAFCKHYAFTLLRFSVPHTWV